MTPTEHAYRVALVLMRDPAGDPELRMSAAHVAIVLEHLTDAARQALDAASLTTAVKEVHHG